MGTCVCALTSPGINTFPPQSMISFAEYSLTISASGPTATIESPFTATAPGSYWFNFPSMVRTMAFVKRVSTFWVIHAPFII